MIHVSLTLLFIRLVTTSLLMLDVCLLVLLMVHQAPRYAIICQISLAAFYVKFLGYPEDII